VSDGQTGTELRLEASGINQTCAGVGVGALPEVVRHCVEDYLTAVDDQVSGAVAGIYEVGSAALGDFRPRHDQIHLVVALADEASSEQRRALVRAERQLQVRGRRAEVWTGTWAALAGNDAELDPLARIVLATSPIVVRGPGQPDVDSNAEQVRTWAAEELRARAATCGSRFLLTRRGVVALVSDAVQLAQVARTGRAWSKAEAGAALHDQVPSRQGRVIFDALGYRGGSTTSMYWGPFERRGDAIGLVKGLVDLVAADARGAIPVSAAGQ
jgi:hypothetical protein